MNSAANILDDIKIQVNESDRLSDVIRIYDRVEKCAELNFKNYYLNAFIPTGNYRNLNSHELEILRFNSKIEYHKKITLIKLSSSLLRRLSDLNLKQILSDKDLNEFYNTEKYKKFIISLIKSTEKYRFKNENYHANPIISNEKNLLTTTYDDRNGKFVGIHIDSWDKLPLNKRCVASNRICFNVGSADRYLLFVNLSVEKLISLTNSDDICNSSDDTSLIEKFYSLYPKYPIFRLKIKPGEGYIAPTENIIHDGSTLGSESLDLQLTIRGYFDAN